MNSQIIIFGKIVRLLYSLFFALPAASKNSIRVMYTHEVKECDLDNFEENIKLMSMTHIFIKPKDFFEWMDSKKIPEGKFILLTFDDGFLSSFNAVKKV